MSVALFVQTPNAVEGNDQTLVVSNPLKSRVDVYHRTSTGKRGRAESWTRTSVEALPVSLVTDNPVAIRLSPADETAVSIGSLTSVGVKALSAFDNAVPNPNPETHQQVVSDLLARLVANDPDLGEYLVDKRITNKVISFTPQEVETEVITPAKTLVTSGVRTELASIPDIKWSKDYINRKVIGNLTDFEVFDIALRERQNVLIKGHAGSGKTMSVLAYASARGMRYYNVSSHIGVEPSQLFGKWNPNEDGHFHWQDGAVTDLVRNGGVLLINEVNFLPERVSTVLFSLLDDRREIQLMDKDGEVVKAHPDLLIVADMNPNYRGTRELNQAWNDRYAHHLEFPYDPEIEAKIIPNTGIRAIASKLREAFDNDEITTPVSTRGLVAFSKNIANAGLDYAIYSYVNTFNVREQAPVKLVIDTMRADIESFMGISTPVQAEVAESLGGLNG